MNPKTLLISILRGGPRKLACATVVVCALMMVAGGTSQAQTFTVLHAFSYGPDGNQPYAGLLQDARGNLYGTTTDGGFSGPGSVYRLTQVQAGWVSSVMTEFNQNDENGYHPVSRLTLGPDGAFYGTTEEGGNPSCSFGCGTVFRLDPSTGFSRTVIYRFSGSDGYWPISELTFDGTGDIFGTTSAGGADNGGTVFELIRNSNQWTHSVVYNFGNFGGEEPVGGLIFDSAGNLYGTTYEGGGLCSCGVVFELSPSDGRWMYRVLHSFDTHMDGAWPVSSLTIDGAGNLYGTTTAGGPGLSAGTVFELSPSGNNWIFSTVHAFAPGYGEPPFFGPAGPVLLDATGALYGTACDDGAYGQGSVFELTPTNGGWVFTTLHDFSALEDGEYPIGNLLRDANGNIFGTTWSGGEYGVGTVWELTP